MGLLDDLKRVLGQRAPLPSPPPRPQQPPPTAAAPHGSLGATRDLGPFKATLLTVADPYVTDVRNGHCSKAYLRGDERLLAIELRLEHGGASDDPIKIGGHKLHLFDDADYMHEPIGLDSRSRSPRLVEGFLMPGGAARGWVTFALDWDRQPRRLQLFTGYLGEGVRCWDLPLMSAEAWGRHRRTHREERLAETAQAALEDKQATISELEAQAALAELLLTREAELSALEARAAEARRVLRRLEAFKDELDPSSDDD